MNFINFMKFFKKNVKWLFRVVGGFQKMEEVDCFWV